MVVADDVMLSNIRDDGNGGVEFEMYVRSGNNGVLNQQALLESVEVSKGT